MDAVFYNLRGLKYSVLEARSHGSILTNYHTNHDAMITDMITELCQGSAIKPTVQRFSIICKGA